jgi:D-glycero-alpha-D-manno-heptose-7-phosphate kinase
MNRPVTTHALLATRRTRCRSVRVRVPLRVDFVGMSDLRPFCEEYGGAVLNANIARWLQVMVSVRGDHRICVRAPDVMPETRTYDSLDDMAADPLTSLAAEVLRSVNWRRGVDIQTYLEMPRGAGLGSSSAYTVGLLVATNAFLGYPRTNMELAALALDIEERVLHVHYGWQDQVSPLLPPGLRFLEISRKADPFSFQFERLPTSDRTMGAVERRALLCYTGASRSAGVVLSDVHERFSSGDRSTISALRRLSDLARQLRIALLVEDIPSVGPIINEVWGAHRELSPAVDTEQIDQVMQFARSHGAEAGRICGAGGGGTVMFWAEDGQDYILRRALQGEGYQVFRLGLQGALLGCWLE